MTPVRTHLPLEAAVEVYFGVAQIPNSVSSHRMQSLAMLIWLELHWGVPGPRGLAPAVLLTSTY